MNKLYIALFATCMLTGNISYAAEPSAPPAYPGDREEEERRIQQERITAAMQEGLERKDAERAALLAERQELANQVRDLRARTESQAITLETHNRENRRLTTQLQTQRRRIIIGGIAGIGTLGIGALCLFMRKSTPPSLTATLPETDFAAIAASRGYHKQYGPFDEDIVTPIEKSKQFWGFLRCAAKCAATAIIGRKTIESVKNMYHDYCKTQPTYLEIVKAEHDHARQMHDMRIGNENLQRAHERELALARNATDIRIAEEHAKRPVPHTIANSREISF